MAPPRSNPRQTTKPHKSYILKGSQSMHLPEIRKEREKQQDHRIMKRYTFKRRGCPASKTSEVPETRIIELLRLLKQGLNDDVNADIVLNALREMRGGLANADHIDTVIQGGIMPLLDACLSHEHIDIRFSAVWIMSNVACGDSEQTALVAQRLDKVTEILHKDADDEPLLAQCLWMLANVAGDSVEHREAVIRRVPPASLQAFVDVEKSSAEVLENIAWFLSNILRQGVSEQQQNVCEKTLPILNSVLDCRACDCRVIIEICRAVLNILYKLGEPNALEQIKQSRIIVNIVRHSNLECNRSCFTEKVKLIADLLSTDDDSCQVFIDQGALNVLSIVMHEELSELYYYACFAIANVFACTSAQIQCAINHNLLSAAIYQLEHGDFKVQREAGIALCSFLGAAKDRQVLQAFNKGLVPPLVQMLRYFDMSIVYDVMASLFNLMKVGEELGMQQEFLQELLDCDIESKVEQLRDHGHEQISELAGRFIDQYLEKDKIALFQDSIEKLN